jgi:uncharacterized protein (DUF2147 family)
MEVPILRTHHFLIAGLLAAMTAPAADNPTAEKQTPAGLWKTVDDKTHKTRGLIRLFEKDGAIYGKIEASFDSKEAADVCDKCGGERKNKPIIGLLVLRDMKKRGDEYIGGDILDPESGWIYKCKMTLQDGGQKLIVRGFLGLSLLGRSQTWFRQE